MKILFQNILFNCLSSFKYSIEYLKLSSMNIDDNILIQQFYIIFKRYIYIKRNLFK